MPVLDRNQDNVYLVTVIASDKCQLLTMREVTVKVTDMPEDGSYQGVRRSSRE